MTRDDHILEAYKRHRGVPYAESLKRTGLDTTILEARGARLHDARGRSFIDFVSGFGIFNFGHNPPGVIRALEEELGKSPLWNRSFLDGPFAHLTERLVALVPPELDRVLLTCSGAEGVDSAIKLARLATKRPGIIAAEGAFHGYTFGALSVSGIPTQRNPFAPLLPGVVHVPFGDVVALAAVLDDGIAAVILEPVQAEVGALHPPDGYLQAVRDLCDQHGTLLIVDEVRTGMGRTGPLFAFQELGAVPDILVIGKALAAGIVPIGAMIARSGLWTRVGLSFAMSASSFGGNRLACTAALATLDLVEAEMPLRRGRANGRILRAALDEVSRVAPAFVQKVTGMGMLLGLHVATPAIAAELVRRGVEAGILTATAFCEPRCLLLEPPLVIDEELMQEGCGRLAETCVSVAREAHRGAR